MSDDIRFSDLSHVSPLAKLAAIVAVTSGHAALFVGPPGVGKTMLARRAAAVMPPLSGDDLAEVRAVRARTWTPQIWDDRAPIRMPHHSVSLAGMIGGDPGRPRPLPPGEQGPLYQRPAAPGELALAHRGVLFLDECAEFSASTLDVIGRAHRAGSIQTRHATWGTRFALLAAMNPCPCGMLGHPDRACSDSPSAVIRYAQPVHRLAFDLVVDMAAPSPIDLPLVHASDAEITAAIRRARWELVAHARSGERHSAAVTAAALGCDARAVAAIHDAGVRHG